MLGQKGGDLHPARGGVDHLATDDAVGVHFREARLDLGVQADDAGVHGGFDFAQVGEDLAFTRLILRERPTGSTDPGRCPATAR